MRAGHVRYSLGSRFLRIYDDDFRRSGWRMSSVRILDLPVYLVVKPTAKDEMRVQVRRRQRVAKKDSYRDEMFRPPYLDVPFSGAPMRF